MSAKMIEMQEGKIRLRRISPEESKPVEYVVEERSKNGQEFYPRGTVHAPYKTKCETNPAKCFSGVGFQASFVGSFYGSKGLERAIEGVLNPSAAKPD